MALGVMIRQRDLEKTQRALKLLEKLRIKQITMYQDPANMTMILAKLEIELCHIK